MSSGQCCSVKICIVGDSNVGKSSLVKCFIDNDFIEEYRPTIGFDFTIKNVLIDDCPVKISIWDISGKDEYLDLARQFHLETDATFIVYDATCRKSFERVITYWYGKIFNLNKVRSKPVYLIGNKCDDPIASSKKLAPCGQAEENFVTNFYGVHLAKVSSKMAFNVNEVFFGCAGRLGKTEINKYKANKEQDGFYESFVHVDEKDFQDYNYYSHSEGPKAAIFEDWCMIN